MKKIKHLLTTVLLLFCFVWPSAMRADVLNIGESITQSRTPIDYYNVDTYQGCQLIYTESELTEMGNSAAITAISFFYENTSTSAAPSATFEVRIGTTDNSYFSSHTNLQSITNSTLVATEIIGGWAAKANGRVKINFTKPYIYTGGNLLIDIRNTSKSTSYSNQVYFTATDASNYQCLKWTGATSASITFLQSGTRSKLRPNIEIVYGLYSPITGISGYTHIHCDEPGVLSTLYKEANFPSSLKVSGYISGKDFEDLCTKYDENDEEYFTHVRDLDLSEANILDYTSSISSDFSTTRNNLSWKWNIWGIYINTMVLPNNCEKFFATNGRLRKVYTNNSIPFPIVFSNRELYVPSGSKNDWLNQLRNGNNGVDNNLVNNCLVIDSPEKTINNSFSLASQLTNQEILSVDILTINCDIDAKDFVILNNMPQLCKLTVNGRIKSYTGTEGPNKGIATYYPANEVPQKAFQNNKSLQEVYLYNCNNYGDYCFQNAIYLNYVHKLIVGSDHTAKVGNYAFDGCINLQTLENYGNYGGYFDIGYTSIGDFAFRNTQVTSIELSSHVGEKEIGDSYIEYNYDACYVPFSHIGKNPFFGIRSAHNLQPRYWFEYERYENYMVQWNYGEYTINDEYTYSRSKAVEILLDSKLCVISAPRSGAWLLQYTMSDDITEVADWAISDIYLQNITISSNLNKIGEAFLYKCTDLKTITGSSDYFTAIDNVLYTADRSKLIKYPAAHERTEFHIPVEVAKIDTWAFESTKNLLDLYVYSSNPIELGDNVFENVDCSSITLHVPYGSRALYMETEGWNKFTNIVEFDTATYYDLTISSVGMATLYLDKAAIIPEGVKVYVASEVNEDRVILEQISNMIPANTGVLVCGSTGVYTFDYTEETVPSCDQNLFLGTVTNTYITPVNGTVPYVLAVVDGDVGMYRAKLNDEGSFLNNANKAYLLLFENKLGVSDEELDTSEPGAQLSNGYRFVFPETTSVGGITLENPQADVYYDLQGRKVIQPKKGMYIFNGKKVLVK